MAYPTRAYTAPIRANSAKTSNNALRLFNLSWAAAAGEHQGLRRPWWGSVAMSGRTDQSAAAIGGGAGPIADKAATPPWPRCDHRQVIFKS